MPKMKTTDKTIDNIRRNRKLLVVLFGLLLATFLAADLTAQPPGRGGPGGPGGPGAPDVKLVDEFDADGDGRLNKDERARARESLKSRSEELRQGRGPGGRRPGGGGRGPGGRGGDRPTGSAGPLVDPADVEVYPQAGLYDENVLRTLFIQFENDDWEQELADFKPTDVEVPATLMVDGQSYPNVGVSFRGASSFFMVPAGLKRSLNVSIDYGDDEQRLYGYKTLNLLNFNGDSGLMSSYLYSQIASQKIAAPKVNFVKVVINGRSWGLYANAQQFNKEMIDENFGTRKGARWKVGGSPRGDGGLRFLGDDVQEYRSRYEIKSKDKEKSWNDLIKLCQVLNETPVEELDTALESILDVDGALWFLAVDVALINSDGYWTRASDYCIYQNPDGKFHVLPHDMNESFRAARGGRGGGPGGRGGRGRRGPGGFGGPGGDGPPPERDDKAGPPKDKGDRPERDRKVEGRERRGAPRESALAGSGYELDPLVGLDQDRFPLRSRLLANPKLKQRYLQYVRTIARDMISWEQMGPQVEKATQLIESEVNADTRKLMTYEAFQKATSLTSPAEPGSLREFAEKRSTFLLEHPAIKDLPKDDAKVKSKDDSK